jgi:hypothetical protein
MTENPLPPETVFLSYAHEDLERVKPILKGFEAHGWTMWVDRIQLRSGDEWAEKIPGMIENAYCAVVVWSKDSIQSEWVKKEATLALAKVGKGLRLFPVQLDRGIKIPEEFNKWHAVDLSEWNGDPDDLLFKNSVITPVANSWAIASDMALRQPLKISPPLKIIKSSVIPGGDVTGGTATVSVR